MNSERSLKSLVSHLILFCLERPVGNEILLNIADGNSQTIGINNQQGLSIQLSPSFEHHLDDIPNDGEPRETSPIAEQTVRQTLLSGMNEWFVCIDKIFSFFAKFQQPIKHQKWNRRLTMNVQLMVEEMQLLAVRPVRIFKSSRFLSTTSIMNRLSKLLNK